MDTELSPALSLRAPGRLHLGFLDPSGSLGRCFGSIGLVIDGFETELTLSAAGADCVTADTRDGEAQVRRAQEYLRTLRAHTGRHQPLHLRLRQVLPEHNGFGSGTQLALAVGRAFAQWHGLEVGTPTLAHWLGRGLRSGIGIHGFDQGGLLLDGGPSAEGRPAPLLSRIALPEAWRVIVVQDEREHGLAGAAEKLAMAATGAMPGERAAEICHEVLMRVLPGAAGNEFALFAAGVSRVQQLLGAHFAPVQQGRAYTSAAVGRWMAWVAQSTYCAALGQSSWGPTGFAIVDSVATAKSLEQAARAAGIVERGVTMRVVTPRNRGAEVVDPRPRPPLR